MIDKRRVIWFNPPFSKGVKTNFGKVFLALVKKYFLPGSPLYPVCNKNIIKLSYGCTRNTKSVIQAHNRTLLNHSNAAQPVNPLCNCRVKSRCPVQGNCQASVFTKPQWNLTTRLQHISGAPTTLRSVTVYTTWTPLLCHYTYGITASTKPPILNGRSSARPNHIDPDVATASYVEIGHTCRQRCWIYIAYYIDTRVWAFDWCELLQSSIQSPYMNTSVSIQYAI